MVVHNNMPEFYTDYPCIVHSFSAISNVKNLKVQILNSEGQIKPSSYLLQNIVLTQLYAEVFLLFQWNTGTSVCVCVGLPLTSAIAAWAGATPTELHPYGQPGTTPYPPDSFPLIFRVWNSGGLLTPGSGDFTPSAPFLYFLDMETGCELSIVMAKPCANMVQGRGWEYITASG